MKLKSIVLAAAAVMMLAVPSAEASMGWFFGGSTAPAGGNSKSRSVNITIDISSQSMSVRVHGFPYAHWKVSTAREGYWTPRGRYRVQRMARVYYSRKYDNAPMPNAIFFKGGYAIHGSGHVRALGRPASHGCVRLHPNNAARLYALVQEYGPKAIRITITE
jgi:lipoprotein-anchoring transpeptidase ErfK/SrfK